MDERGNVVGMVIEDQQPNAVAISIDTVLAALRAAGYPIQLTPANTNSASPPPPPPNPSPQSDLLVQPTPSGALVVIDDRFSEALGRHTPVTVKLDRQIGRA